MLYDFDHMEVLILFLETNFNQNMVSTEIALDEIKEEYSIRKNNLEKVINAMEWFLTANIKERDRVGFIKKKTCIDFERINKSPVEWLTEIQKFLIDLR